MKHTQGPDKRDWKAEIAKRQKDLAALGVILSDDMRTIRITAGCVPEEPKDLDPDDDAEERRQRDWSSFTSGLVEKLRLACLTEPEYLLDPKFKDVENDEYDTGFIELTVEPEDDSPIEPEDDPEPETDEDKKPERWVTGVKLNIVAPAQVVVDEDNPYLLSQDGVLFNKDKTELIWYPYGKEDKTYTVPHGVKRIGRRAFYGYYIKVDQKYSDGSSVPDKWDETAKCYSPKQVMKYVFHKNLTHVVMPDTVEVVGENAFDHCIFLESVRLSSALKDIQEKAFNGCKGLKEVDLPDSLTHLHRHSFSGCGNLKTVRFLGTRAQISEKDTWRGMRRQQYGPEPYTTEFFIAAFSDTEQIIFADENESYASVDGVVFNRDRTELIFCPRRKSGWYTIPATVTHIKAQAFQGCTELTEVCISGPDTTVEGSAFSGCTGLGRVTTQGSGSIKYIGDAAFYGCKALQDAALARVEHIGDKAFTQCTALGPDVKIGRCKHIGASAFQDCEALRHVYLSDVEHIGASAFYGCTVLGPSVGLPKCCKYVGKDTFSECRDLKELRYPRELRVGQFAVEVHGVGLYGEYKYTIRGPVPDPNDKDSIWINAPIDTRLVELIPY